MIHESAIIDPTAVIGKNVTVGPWTIIGADVVVGDDCNICLLYTSPSPRDRQKSRMPSSA